MFKKSLVSLGCALAVMSGSANAGVVYNEFVSGDSGPWYFNGGVAIGNVQSGDYVLGRMETADNSAYWEGYNFYLDGSVSIINIAALTGPSHNYWQLYNGVGWGPTIRSGLLNSVSQPVNFDVAGLTGYYTLGNNINITSWAYNYQISFDTASDAVVPEPGTLALLGLGIAGFCAMRRRKA